MFFLYLSLVVFFIAAAVLFGMRPKSAERNGVQQQQVQQKGSGVSAPRARRARKEE